MDLKPDNCPSGQFYCGDGKCHLGPSQAFACVGVDQVCSCPNEAQTKGYLPCKNTLKVNVKNIAHASDALLVQECKDVVKQVNESTLYVRQCKPQDPVVFSLLNSEFVIFYIFAILESCLLGSYILYKSKKRDEYQETKMKNMQGYSHIPVIEQGVPVTNIKFKAYKQDRFGSLVKHSIFWGSICWLLVLAVLIGDYYEIFATWATKNETLIFMNHDNLSKVFIVFWNFTTLWFLFLQSKKSAMKTLFLTQADLSEATFVLIEKTRPSTVHGGDLGKIVEIAQKVESWIRNYTKTNISREIKKIQITKSGRIYVEFECVRYIYNEKLVSFEPYKFDITSTNSQVIQLAKGLTDSEAYDRMELIGPNQILFEVNTFWQGVVKEFSGIFYLYQLMMLLVWYFYAYYYMGLVLTSIIIGSGIIKVLVSNAAQKRVLDMATFHGTANVLRNARWTEISTSQLVVGDVFEVQVTGDSLSVDCAILSGDVVVDESSLTGEALPVSKVAVKNDSKLLSKEANAKLNCLFAGTIVLETQQSVADEKVIAVVLATGGSTEKGKLVRDILHPVPFIFVFTEHLKVVVPILILWGIVLLLLSLGMLKVADVGSWFYGMFGISQVLSPALPAVLVIGQSVSAERLRTKGIMCIDLNRITLAGKVRVFCFDKTGTLTKEGLEFGGAHEIKNGSFIEAKQRFSEFSKPIQLAMETCHSIALAQGKCVGNFVDIELFKSTGAAVDVMSNTTILTQRGTKVKITKRFEFLHAHTYMSTVCVEEGDQNAFVFLKGSFEKILAMSKRASVPANFIETAKNHASQGYYVLAIAAKKIPIELAYDTKVTREEYENDVEIIGLILFRNELKADTREAIAELKEGGCRTVMITGDHANTALFIGKTSGLISKNEYGIEPQILMAEYVDNDIKWTDVDKYTVLSQREVEDAIYRSRKGGKAVELVIVGLAFNYLLEYYWLPQFIGEVRIFARMSPLDKSKCVRLHMTNHITAMCGDGGNDAGALKAAHAGIALSSFGTSVVSHFSSNDLSIKSCVELLKEARCSLDVSMASYKMLILYGELLAISGLLQYYFVVQMSQAMWVFIDGCTVPLSWALTIAQPASKLIKSRPTARLLGFETMFSVIGQLVINAGILGLTASLLYDQSFFRCFEFDSSFVDLRLWWQLADNYEGSITGIITAFQILHVSCALNIGSKYRNGFAKNKIFIMIYTTLFMILSYVLLVDPNPIGCHFHINCGTKETLEDLGYTVWFNTPSEYFNATGHNVIPRNFRFVLFLLVVLNLALVMIWEGIIIQGPVREWAKSWANGRWQVKKIPLNE